MARFDLRNRRKREKKKSSFSSVAFAYNQSLKLLDTDDREAFRLNCIAAQAGMHDAVLAMGWFYSNGVGVEADEQAAVGWYKKSARQGDPKAMFSLGEIAYCGQDYAEALTWFTRAARNGHQRSNYWIGKMYWRGKGVAQNQALAKDYFARAAAGKYPEAKRVLRYLAFLAQSSRARGSSNL